MKRCKSSIGAWRASPVVAWLLALLVFVQPLLAFGACGERACAASGSTCCCVEAPSTTAQETDPSVASCCAKASIESESHPSLGCGCRLRAPDLGLAAIHRSGSSEDLLRNAFEGQSDSEHARSLENDAAQLAVIVWWKFGGEVERASPPGVGVITESGAPNCATTIGAWRALRDGASGKLSLLSTLRI